MLMLFCLNNQVVASHDSAQSVDAGAYGDGAFAIPAPADWSHPTLPCPVPDTTTESLLAYANAKQWALATGGYTTTVNGQSITVATDATSQLLMTGKAMRLGQKNPPASIAWQLDSGFVTLAAADFLVVASAADDFVQSTFDKLKEVEAAIRAAPPTITTTADIDAAFAAAA